MKNQVRAFIAVNLSQQIRANAAKLIRSLQSQLDFVRWVESENMHVTLKFLGDIPINELYRIVSAIRAGADQVESFDLEFLGCGAFPDMQSPRTIWIGCNYGADELTRLAGAIENELFKIGYPKENRRFSPHLTIGRIKKGHPASDGFLPAFFAEQQDHVFGSCSIDELVLYSSELTRRGPIYDELAVIPLR